MSQSAKRSLRIRKTPAYLLSDNEDQGPLSYPRQIYQMEIISPAQELNNFAKLLSKFINSVNKRSQILYLDARQISKNDPHDKLKDQELTLPKQKNINKPQVRSQSAHKKLLLKEPTKQEELKQSKILSNHKSQEIQLISNKFINADEQKLTKSYSKGKIQNYNVSQKINKQRLKQSKKLSIEQNSSLIKSKQALMKPAYLQQQNQQRTLLENLPGIRNRISATQQNQKKNIPTHIKIFGRSAYHIGIAYHIHLRQLELKKVNINDLNAVDPTYFARKLRQEFFEPERTENQPNTF